MNITVTNVSQNLWTSLLSDAQRTKIQSIIEANGNVKVVIYNASATSTDIVYIESWAAATSSNGYIIEQKKECTIFSTNLANYYLIGNVATIDVRILVMQW